MNWYVLCVKAKKEKKIAEQLSNRGITVYCPLIIEVRQWSDRKKKVEVPLISSYLFVQLEEKYRADVFEVDGVSRYLFWLGKPAMVRNEEIELLKNWLKTDVIDAQVETLQKGDSFCVPTGPFKGHEGLVKEINNNRIQILLLQLGMKITITRQKE